MFFWCIITLSIFPYSPGANVAKCLPRPCCSSILDSAQASRRDEAIHTSSDENRQSRRKGESTEEQEVVDSRFLDKHNTPV